MLGNSSTEEDRGASLQYPESLRRKESAPLFLGLTAQELYESVNAMPFYLWIHSDDHRLVFHNQVVTEKFGDCLGRHCHTCLMGKKDACSCCKTKEILESKQPSQCQGCRRGGNGQLYDTYHSPLVKQNGSKYVISLSFESGNGHAAQDEELGSKETKSNEEKTFCSMCAACKRIKDSKEKWIPVERFLADRFHTVISHGICRPCMEKLYPEIDY
jgi:hypothetical protein